MLGKFITETYNKVKSKADEVRLHVSVQAVKAKGALGLANPKNVEELMFLLNYELQHISTAEHLIDTYKKWIHSLEQSEKSDCIRFCKSIKKTDEQNLFPHEDDGKKEWIRKKKMIKENEMNMDAKEISQEVKEKQGDAIEKNVFINYESFEKQVELSENSTERTKNEEHRDENEHEKREDTNRGINNISNENKNVYMCTYEKTLEIEKDKTEEENEINIYDDLYGYNFKEIFLKSNILEKSVSLILENRNIRLPLVGPIEEEDLENPRTIILTLFKYCLRGNMKLHKNILFIILTTDTLVDSHKELFLELLRILKFDYLDTYLTNIRKIIASEVVSLKAKIQSHNSLNNWREIISNCSSESKQNMINNLLLNDKENWAFTENKSIDEISLYLKNEEKTKEKSREDVSFWDESKLIKEKKNISEREENGKETREHPYNKTKEEINDKTSTKVRIKERDIVENNTLQQMKILASSKLIDLHKTVYKILLMTAQTREKRKIEIQIKLKELKKIMEVCQKDCELTLYDTEGSKTSLENTYLEQADLLKENIKRKQEEAQEIKKNIDNLVKRKNELYQEYEMVSKEIHLKNKELSQITSFITMKKKELTQTKDLYFNKISNTSKEKHMQQERKLYISNLNTISDEILHVYESGECIDIQELKKKSEKIKKPLKQVIIQHLNYLKEKLILLNVLLNFYVEQVKSILEKNIYTEHSIQEIHKNEKTQTDKQLPASLENEIPNKILLTGEDSTQQENDIKKKGNEIKILKYNKNCYFKVVDQINKMWIIVQKFYEQNKKQIEEEEEEKEKEEKEETEEEYEENEETGTKKGRKNENIEIEKTGKQIQIEINNIYNISKQIIRENNPIILSI